jgi:hypothetical protein
MTPLQFRRLALALPDATEGAHMGHADFRHGGRIFATLGHPGAAFGMVKLTPDQQAMLVATTPEIFLPVPGGWGRRGYTNVRLAAADGATLKHALALAWQNCAPKRTRAIAKDQRADAERRGDARDLRKASPARKSSRARPAPKA